MIEEKVGKRIKELRKKLCISQEELAFRSGVHRTYIASLEVGKKKYFYFNFGKDCYCSQRVVE